MQPSSPAVSIHLQADLLELVIGVQAASPAASPAQERKAHYGRPAYSSKPVMNAAPAAAGSGAPGSDHVRLTLSHRLFAVHPVLHQECHCLQQAVINSLLLVRVDRQTASSVHSL